MIGSLASASFAFAAPWLLVGLIALPVLWWLLRAVPPAPGRRAFPGVRLLLGLRDPEKMPERTPWWLLALRVLALGLAVLAFAGPVLNPRPRTADGPLLVLLDGGWGDAPDWAARMARAQVALEEAARDGRPAAVLSMTQPVPAETAPPMRSAQEWSERLAGFSPRGWGPDRAAWADWLNAADGNFDTLWLSDGVSDGAEGALASALMSHGSVTLVAAPDSALALTPPRLENGALTVTALRSEPGAERAVGVLAIGPDPNGVERALGTGAGAFAAGEATAEVALDLPAELRNRVARIALTERRSAAGVALADDSVRRRKVGLISGGATGEAQDLADPLHYLRRALEPFAELIEAPLSETLNAAPDVLILADVGALNDAERTELTEWVERGGLLVRFAGPRLAQSGAGQTEADPLLPVRLRAGGRSVGGAMSWGAPRKLRPFAEGSPFAGIPVPEEVDVSSQVMAQPDPELPNRVIATLEDGTPLVTGKTMGDGRVVLFHVTANADWSNLPLSGLFVRMLERLTQSAGGLADSPDSVAGTVWSPALVMNGFGDTEPPSMVAGVPGERLVAERTSSTMPPGIYASGDRRIAVNVMREGDRLAPLAGLPVGLRVETFAQPEEVRLGPWLLAGALLLLALDALATLRVSGRLGRLRARRGAAVAASALLAAALAFPGGPARAGDGPWGQFWDEFAPPSPPATIERVQGFGDDEIQGFGAAPYGGRSYGARPAPGPEASADERALYGANETVLAYVRTGDRRVDGISEAGLRGLSRVLFDRTAIEPAEPVGVDLETDELAMYPFLYWPISEAQPSLSDAAYGRLNDYLRFGGMILFDTRDADLGATMGATTPNGRVLQRIAVRLDIPPLEPVPDDHVMTRTFYLLQDFPGRWANSQVWVEAAPEAQQVEGMPFRNLNDGVTPVVIGGNDWASAWAERPDGSAMFPVGRGIAGERQREMAMRFGVNLIMYVMTGNYKSDQVHVPALLDRLGQ
ncbi:MAG: LytTR family transcriptional regulator [Rhodovulum sulfidophilum]|uniref:LytTR family transcriptional regulator n=1 Tax=Rhodovulum sulfidophilum TaxID=35806 RepID=A0A2W5NCU3_RHOSU|nr:MAG: LytTR family transcriptional regulator [Rhodovulum sulfidophilum]